MTPKVGTKRRLDRELLGVHGSHTTSTGSCSFAPERLAHLKISARGYVTCDHRKGCEGYENNTCMIDKFQADLVKVFKEKGIK